MTRIETILLALQIPIMKRRSRRAWSLCPFHEDKQPDHFFVRLDGERVGNYHCFSCKVGGSLIDLVMHVRRIDFKGAKAFIAAAGKGYEAPRAKVRVLAQPPELARVRFVLPREIEIAPLAKWPTLARRYAVERGLTEAEVELFGLGYALSSRLGGRIVFPVRVPPNDRAVGYSARTFVNDEPKYKTPHEDENADKDAIFGEHLWPKNEAERHIVAVTEGAVDALAVRRATGFHIGSLSGSDVLPGHMLKLMTFDVIVVLTDRDAPGEKAAKGIASACSRYSRCVRPILPDDKDAASMPRPELSAIIESALDVARAS